MFEIGSCVRYVGASPDTERRSQGRVGTVRHLATWQGTVGAHPPTACVTWSASVNDWSYVLMGELVLVPKA